MGVSNPPDYGQFESTGITPSYSVTGAGTEKVAEPAQKGYSTKDTIGPADDLTGMMLLYLPNSPILIAPTDQQLSISSATLGDWVQLKLSEICLQVANAWTQSLQEQKQHQEEEWRLEDTGQVMTPQLAAQQQLQASLKAGSSTAIAIDAALNSAEPTDLIRIINDNQAIRAALIDGVDNFVQSQGSSSNAANSAIELGFMAGALAIAGPLVLSNPVSGQYLVIDPATVATMLPADPAGAASVIAALFGAGAAFYAGFVNVAQAAKEGPKVADVKNLAVQYASRIIQLAQSGILSNFILAAVSDKLPNAANMTEQQKQQVMLSVKVILLSTALAALYKADNAYQSKDGAVGHITAQEYLGLLNGTTQVDPNSQQGQLIAMINADLNNPNMPSDVSNKLKNAVADYMDTNPGFGGLFDLQGVVSSISNTLPLTVTA